MCVHMRICVHLCTRASRYDYVPLCLRVSMYASPCAFAFVSVCAHVCVRCTFTSVCASLSVRSCLHARTHVSFRSLPGSVQRDIEVRGGRGGGCEDGPSAAACLGLVVPSTCPVRSDPESPGRLHAAESRSGGRDASRVSAASTFDHLHC